MSDVSVRADLPEGRVTFLFTDVEGSTRLLEEHPADYGRMIARHHDLLAGAVEARGGVVFETIGDAVYAAFAVPADAVAAAAEAQLALLEEDWSPLGQIRLRMGLHSGLVARRGAHYFGPALYRCARLTATAHGGQRVLSEATAKLVEDALEDETTLVDLPSDVKTFVGRQAELDAVRTLLVSPDVRLVTLTGTGGSGKTRLALRVAGSLLEPFKDGVFLVDLAPLPEPELVLSAVAEVLRVPPTAGRSPLDSRASSCWRRWPSSRGSGSPGATKASASLAATPSTSPTWQRSSSRRSTATPAGRRCGGWGTTATTFARRSRGRRSGTRRRSG